MTVKEPTSSIDSSNKTDGVNADGANNVIQLSDIQFTYKKSTLPTLFIPEWNVEKNQSVFLYGPSGSGKSTLLNILGGLLVPQQGTVSVLDNTLNRLSSSKRDRFRAQHIGIIFQQFNLIPWLTVKENIESAYFFSKKKLNNQKLIEDTYNLLDSLQLPKTVIDKQTQELSIGQQQRVAIARALINQPEIIIADEPTSSLDADARDSFMELLFSVVESINSTLIFVSHDKHLQGYFEKVVDLKKINQASEAGANINNKESGDAV